MGAELGGSQVPPVLGFLALANQESYLFEKKVYLTSKGILREINLYHHFFIELFQLSF